MTHRSSFAPSRTSLLLTYGTPRQADWALQACKWDSGVPGARTRRVGSRSSGLREGAAWVRRRLRNDVDEGKREEAEVEYLAGVDLYAFAVI